MFIPAGLLKILKNTEVHMGPLSVESTKAVLETMYDNFSNDQMLTPEFNVALSGLLEASQRGMTLAQMLAEASEKRPIGPLNPLKMDEGLLDRILRDYPNLTRAKALKMAEEFGYDLTGPSFNPSTSRSTQSGNDSKK
jgi:hypothetical protein